MNIGLSFFSRSFDFEFIPDRLDVGKRVAVKTFVVAIGRQDADADLELEIDCFDDGDDDDVRAEFSTGKVFLKDLDSLPLDAAFSKVEIEPRSPGLKMELHYKGRLRTSGAIVVELSKWS